MNKQEIKKSLDKINGELRHIQERLTTTKIVETKDPEEKHYHPLCGTYFSTNSFELKEAVVAILDHLGLKLSKTVKVPERTILIKKNNILTKEMKK